MANTFSSLKRVRQTRRKTDVNRLRKTRLRHQIRSVRRLIEQKDRGAAQAALPATFSLIDRSAKWGIIKKNTAARYKSRLTLRLRKLAAYDAVNARIISSMTMRSSGRAWRRDRSASKSRTTACSSFCLGTA